MKIISWNVASIRARMPALTRFLSSYDPDIVMLQEIKSTDETFPFFDLRLAGYESYIAGQKSWNGVALLSKHPLKNVLTQMPTLPLDENDQARFIQGESLDGILYICVYVPNGNPPDKDPEDDSRLQYKLKWMSAFNTHIQNLLQAGRSIVLGGDFNVIELDTDVYDPDLYRTNALMLQSVRDQFKKLSSSTVLNTVRSKHPEPHYYSFWDFQMNAYKRNMGMLLDHLFISQNLAGRLIDAGVYKDVRGWEKTSDHAPIWCDLK